MHKQLKYLLMAAFIEGAAVMTVELVSAKLIGPYFGTSLYVWASVLGVTMAGLAGGYYLGGLLSSREGKGNSLGWVLALAGIMIGLMPFTSRWVMQATLQWDVRWGSMLSCMVYLLPPICLLGMVSPLLIRRGTVEPAQAGRVAGLVYAISTLGGILMTFLLGFYGMSRWGLRLPLIAMGAIILVLSIIVFFTNRKQSVANVTLLVVGFAILASSAFLGPGYAASGKLIYSDEGVGGQILVMDQQLGTDSVRTLYLNGLNQSSVRKTEGRCSVHPYVAQVGRVAGLQPAGARCMLLGMGGGSLLGELMSMGHVVEGCELDPRMLSVAEDLYGVPVSKSGMREADARVCINQMEGLYDLVVADIYYGDNSPAHVLTRESLSKVREHLALTGTLVVLFPGPEDSPAFRAMVHTLYRVGFQVSLLSPEQATVKGKLLVASHLAFNQGFFQPRSTTPCLEASGLPPFPPSRRLEDPMDADLLTDNMPVLEQMLLQLRNLRTQ